MATQIKIPFWSPNKTLFVIILLGIGMSLFVWQCTKRLQAKATLEVHDTVYKKVYLIDSTNGGTTLIPNKQIFYDTIPIPIYDTIKVYISQNDGNRNLDTIKLYYHDTVLKVIASAFLANYRDSKKFVFGKFELGSMKLDLYGTDGKMETKMYTTNYDKFRYEFNGTELKQFDTQDSAKGLNKFFNNIKAESYLSTTYNPFTNGATVRMDYSLMYKGIGATVFGSWSTDQTPHGNAGVGLKVKIK